MGAGLIPLSFPIEIPLILFAQYRLSVLFGRPWAWLLYLFMPVAFLASSDVRYYLPVAGTPVVWMINTIIVWLYASAAGYFIHEVIGFVKRRTNFDPSRRRVLHLATESLVAGPLAVIGYGTFIGRTQFQVRELDLPIANLPPDLEGIRLVQLSDIHLSPFLSESEFARMIDAANTTHAHIALITGDLISSKGDPLDACLHQLARLNPIVRLGCMGNHEIAAGSLLETERGGARIGLPFLRHAATPLRFGAATLNVCGVDYQRMSQKKNYLAGAETLIQPGAVNLLLSHNPDVFPVAAAKGFDAMLSGHTHGGQMNVEILNHSFNPVQFLTPYTYGIYRHGAATAYVTRGIGTTTLPSRVGAPPEVALLRLKRA